MPSFAQSLDLRSADYQRQGAFARVARVGLRLNPAMDMALEKLAGSSSAHGTSILGSTLWLIQVVDISGVPESA